jgi:hypothetical protein
MIIKNVVHQLYLYMKYALPIFLLFLVPLAAFSQKIKVDIIKNEAAAVSEWQILDDNYMPVFTGAEYFRSDSVTFSLEANKRYFLYISVTGISDKNATLYTLILNGEPLILVNSDIETGDQFLPFFTGTRSDETKITGGTTASISDFPWQVYLISGTLRCGGSIIADNWILTAAHCTRNSNGTTIPASSMSVKVGANNPSDAQQGKTYLVSEAIVHELYDSQTRENDIALLRLQQPVNYTNARPIKLVIAEDVNNGATDPGVMSWVTGWGLIRVSPAQYPTSLQKVQLPVVTRAQAATVWGNIIPKTDIMAGYENGNKDACSGDSGGPLVVPVIDEYKLAGIVSWGSNNCNTFGGYTRVSDFENWIRSKTGIVKEFIPPVPQGDTVICQGELSSDYSVSPVAGASSYEWRLSPSNAGIVTYNAANARVTWNAAYSGSATLLLRVTVSNTPSEWSQLDLKVVLNTRLISNSGDTVICAQQPVILSVKAEGYNLIYRWYRDGLLVQNGKSGQLIISSATVQNSGSYVCVVSGYCGSVSSRAIRLTVHPLTKITSVSPDVEVPFGEEVTLFVKSDGHNLTYLWQKDGLPFANSNSPEYTLLNMNAEDIGLYRSVVTGTCGTEISESIYVYVRKGALSVSPEVFLWPSVTSNEFNVALSNSDLYSVRVFNAGGQLVREHTNCRYQVTINISTLARGSYIVRVFNQYLTSSIKIIKN